MRVSDLVKDVIFLVGSMECFSQVKSVDMFLMYTRGQQVLFSCCISLFLVIFHIKRGEPSLGGDGGCSLHHGCDCKEC